MISFRLVAHSVKGTQAVEICKDGEVVGCLYPTLDGIKLMSAHIAGEPNYIERPTDFPPIPIVLIDFDPQPYRIGPDGIEKLQE